MLQVCVRRILAAGMASLGLLLLTAPPPTQAISTAGMPSDFNGDGYVDLAIGVPYEHIGGIPDAGMVNVLYGSATGLTAAADQSWTQDSPGVKGVIERVMNPEFTEGERFGERLASGDFDGDGYADLAIGVPYEDATFGCEICDCHRGGAVNVLYGSAAGLTADGDQYLTPSTLQEAGQRWDVLGGALASGDFDADGSWELVLSVHQSDCENSIGGPLVLRGSPAGLGLTDAVLLAWSMAPASLATGDLDGDGFIDLATGGSSGDSRGRVLIFSGSLDGLSGGSGQEWTQDSPGIADEAELSDHFGSGVAIGDFDGDGYGDLAAGVSGERDWPSTSEGAVSVIYGSVDGLEADGNQLWSQDSPGVPGSDGSYDYSDCGLRPVTSTGTGPTTSPSVPMATTSPN